MPIREASPSRAVQRADADPSEREDGPSLIAVWGEDDGSNAYQLGTREVDWHSHLRGKGVLCGERVRARAHAARLMAAATASRRLDSAG